MADATFDEAFRFLVLDATGLSYISSTGFERSRYRSDISTPTAARWCCAVCRPRSGRSRPDPAQPAAAKDGTGTLPCCKAVPTISQGWFSRSAGRRLSWHRRRGTAICPLPVRHFQRCLRARSAIRSAGANPEVRAWPGRHPSGLPRSSKYCRVTLNTIGASSSSPIKLGTAIRPFSVSARFHTRSTFTFAKARAAATHNVR